MNFKELTKDELVKKLERTEDLLCECIYYIAEVKEREDNEEWIDFWKHVIGMDDKELEYYSMMEGREEE